MDSSLQCKFVRIVVFIPQVCLPCFRLGSSRLHALLQDAGRFVGGLIGQIARGKTGHVLSKKRLETEMYKRSDPVRAINVNRSEADYHRLTMLYTSSGSGHIARFRSTSKSTGNRLHHLQPYGGHRFRACTSISQVQGQSNMIPNLT